MEATCPLDKRRARTARFLLDPQAESGLTCARDLRSLPPPLSPPRSPPPFSPSPRPHHRRTRQTANGPNTEPSLVSCLHVKRLLDPPLPWRQNLLISPCLAVVWVCLPLGLSLYLTVFALCLGVSLCLLLSLLCIWVSVSMSLTVFALCLGVSQFLLLSLLCVWVSMSLTVVALCMSVLSISLNVFAVCLGVSLFLLLCLLCVWVSLYFCYCFCSVSGCLSVCLSYLSLLCVWVSLYVSYCLCFVSGCLSISLTVFALCLGVSPSLSLLLSLLCVWVSLRVCLSYSLCFVSGCLSVPVSLTVFASCLGVCLREGVLVCMSVCFCLCLSVYPSLSLSLSICLTLSLPASFLSAPHPPSRPSFAQSARAEATHKGVDQRSKDLTLTRKQRPQSTVTLTLVS